MIFAAPSPSEEDREILAPTTDVATNHALAGRVGSSADIQRDMRRGDRPRELVARTYGDTMKILNDAAFCERYVTRQWFEVVCNTPEEFAASIRTECAGTG
jgi:hypothetical protein